MLTDQTIAVLAAIVVPLLLMSSVGIVRSGCATSLAWPRHRQ